MADRTITTDLIASDRMGPAFDSAGKSADKASQKLKGFGKAAAGLTAGVGAVAGAGLAKGFSDNLDISAGNAKLKGQLGLTTAQAKTAGEAASQVYGDNWGESMDDVNGAIKAVSDSLGGLGGKGAGDIARLTEKALALSSTFGEDVTATAQAAGQMVKNGLARNAAEAFDVLTVGYQKGANASGDLLDTFNEYGPQFAKLGIGGSTALGLLNQGLKAGARNTDIIADAFKEFSIRAVDGSTLTAEGFKGIGLNADKMAAAIAKGGPSAEKATAQTITALQKIKDPVQQNIIGTKLFGTQWEDLGPKAFAALDPMEAKAMDVKGATDKMSDAVGNTAKGRIETAKRSFEQWEQSMASSENTLGLISTAVITMGGDALTGASQLGTMALAMRGSTIAAKAGAAATAILNGGLRAMRVAATLALGPWGLIALAVIAGGVALVAFYRKSETFRNIVNGSFKAVANTVLGAISKIIGAFADLFHVMGKLPGRAGAGFRAAEAAARRAKGAVDTLRASINRVPSSKHVKIYVGTIFYQRGKEPGSYGNGLGVIAPGRAVGGPVAKGQPYVVGERSAELFVPDQDGTIVPNVTSRVADWSGGGGPAAGGGMSITNIYVTQPLASAQQIGDAVVRAFEQRPAGARRLPAGSVAR